MPMVARVGSWGGSGEPERGKHERAEGLECCPQEGVAAGGAALFASDFLQAGLRCKVRAAAPGMSEGSAATTSGCAGSVFHTGATGSRWPFSCWAPQIPDPLQQGPDCLSSAACTVPGVSLGQSPAALEGPQGLRTQQEVEVSSAGPEAGTSCPGTHKYLSYTHG